MGPTTDARGDDTSRVRWNDIRYVGPVLVVVLAAVLMLSPQFSPSSQSAGVGGEVCEIDECEPVLRPIRRVDFLGDCGFDEFGPGVFLTDGNCCILIEDFEPGIGEEILVGGGFFGLPECRVDNTPLGKYVAPPPPIKGPIVAGPITSVVNGIHVKMTVPAPLAAMIGPTGIVQITDSAGDVVYHGGLSGNMMTFPEYIGEASEFTVKTRLITGAEYSEDVTVNPA